MLMGPARDVLRCLTDDGFVSRGQRGGNAYTAQFQRGIVTLRRRAELPSVRVRLLIEYTVNEAIDRAGWWEATIAGWVYDVLDRNGRPILAFHWHPLDSGRVTWPHLHAYGAHDSVDMHKLHPPTGHVTLSSVVRFLIEDLGVLPRQPSWPAVLERHAAV
jgi:hypothetical protein